MFECYTCERAFRTRQSRDQHMDDTYHWSFECLHCSKSFSTAHGRKSHTEAIHRRVHYRTTALISAIPEPVVTAAPTESILSESETGPTQEQFRTKFLSGTTSMFNQATASDAVVLIEDVSLPIHQLVVCLQSPYLNDAFKEAIDSTGNRKLALRGGSAVAHWRVFEYLYTGDYSDSTSNHALREDPDLLKHVRVYAHASKFLLEHLQSLALSKFKLQLGTLGNSKPIFFECVQEIYSESSCRALRSAVVEVAVTHFHALATKHAFLDLLHQGGDFAYDYLIGVHRRYSFAMYKLR